MAYNPYDDLTPMERIRLANEEFLRASLINIIDQEQQLEKANEYEGKKLYEGEDMDITSELTDIDESFRYLNVNVKKLKTYLEKLGVEGGEFTRTYAHRMRKPNPDDYTGEFPDENGVMQSYFDVDRLREDEKKYKVFENLKDIYTINSNYVNNFINEISTIIYKLNIIIEYTLNIIKEIRDYGDENFDFSQFNNTIKLFNNFTKVYTEDVVDYLIYIPARGVYENILQELLDVLIQSKKESLPGALLIEDCYNLINEFNKKSIEVIKLYNDIKQISQEKGTRKLQGSGKNRDLNRKYHWGWM